MTIAPHTFRAFAHSDADRLIPMHAVDIGISEAAADSLRKIVQQSIIDSDGCPSTKAARADLVNQFILEHAPGLHITDDDAQRLSAKVRHSVTHSTEYALTHNESFLIS